ncbi:hypothetical protein KCP69_02095 [Salmonella enterica subsp. enterica]|nr:hypothetical protein KCP69_02095 [Salmonella enterica subsp. enterica]
MVEKKAHRGWAESFRSNSKTPDASRCCCVGAAFAYPSHIAIYAHGHGNKLPPCTAQN